MKYFRQKFRDAIEINIFKEENDNKIASIKVINNDI